MDNSKPQASSSPSIIPEWAMPPENGIIEATTEEFSERMPPENGIIEAAIEEAMPPEPREEMPPLPIDPRTGRPDHRPWRYDDPWPARDRILAAVGHKNVPPDLNRDELRTALELDIANYRDLDEFRSGHLWKNKVAELREFQRLSSLVRSVLWPLPSPGEELRRVENWCRSMLTELDHGWHPERWHPGFEGKSSIALLVGHILPKTFERCFGRPASGTRTGPYVRFVMAVLKEYKIKKNNGEDYGRETIASEFYAARKGHIRRKGRRVPQTTKPAEDITAFNPPHSVLPF
jgi:hypothetical protein